jgi:hypothetical protein
MTQNPGKPTPDQPPAPAHTYGDALKFLQDDGVHEELERLRGSPRSTRREAAIVAARTSDDRAYNRAGLRVRSAP